MKVATKRIGRMLIDLLGGADLSNGSGLHDNDAVAETHGFDLIMGDIDGRHPDAVLKLAQLLARRMTQFRVEV